MQEPSERELEAFTAWKAKHQWPEATLARQKELREFKARYGVDTRSNFHCPWCFNGSLYDCVGGAAPGVVGIEVPEGYTLYICRSCHLKFLIRCCDLGALGRELANRSEERQAAKDQKTGKERTSEEIEEMRTAWMEAQED